MSMNNIKNSIKTGAKYFIVANILIPIGGLLAHLGAEMTFAAPTVMSDETEFAGQSLKHRFETAYCFNTPESHKTYYGITGTYGHHEDEYYTGQTPYMASPYATYGTMGAITLLGLLAGYKRKEK